MLGCFGSKDEDMTELVGLLGLWEIGDVSSCPHQDLVGLLCLCLSPYFGIGGNKPRYLPVYLLQLEYWNCRAESKAWFFPLFSVASQITWLQELAGVK